MHSDRRLRRQNADQVVPRTPPQNGNRGSTLPCDILLQIFGIAHHDNDVFRNTTSIILSHVSRYWRSIALSGASLWTNLNLLDGPEHVKAVVNRSHKRPLRIVLCHDGDECFCKTPHPASDPFCCGVRPEEVISRLEATISTIHDTAARWECLDISTTFCEVFSIIFRPIISIGAPILHTMDIHYMLDPELYIPVHSLAAIPSAQTPSLRRLTFTSLMAITPLPGSTTITHVLHDQGLLHLGDRLEMLAATPAVRELGLRNMECYIDELAPPVGIVTLPDLVYMNIHCIDSGLDADSQLAQFFRCISTPCLEKLALNTETFTMRKLVRQLQSVPCIPTVKTLHLDCLPYQESHVALLSEWTPGVRILELRESWHQPSCSVILNALLTNATDMDASLLWPVLTTVVVCRSASDDLYDLVRRLEKTRRCRLAPLTVNLHTRRIDRLRLCGTY